MKYNFIMSNATTEQKNIIKNLTEKYINENNLSSKISKNHHCYYLYDIVHLVKEETQNFILTHIFDTVWSGKEGDHGAYYLTIKNDIIKIFRVNADAYEPYYHYETLKDSINKSLEYQAIDFLFNWNDWRNHR